jgi:hypothetical protein
MPTRLSKASAWNRQPRSPATDPPLRTCVAPTPSWSPSPAPCSGSNPSTRPGAIANRDQENDHRRYLLRPRDAPPLRRKRATFHLTVAKTPRLLCNRSGLEILSTRPPGTFRKGGTLTSTRSTRIPAAFTATPHPPTGSLKSLLDRGPDPASSQQVSLHLSRCRDTTRLALTLLCAALPVDMRWDVVKQGAGFGAGIGRERGNGRAVRRGCVCRSVSFAARWRGGRNLRPASREAADHRG